MFCLLVVLVRLSVPVQVIDWKDSVPKMTFDVLMGTSNPTHSLTYSFVTGSSSSRIIPLVTVKPILFACSLFCELHDLGNLAKITGR